MGWGKAQELRRSRGALVAALLALALQILAPPGFMTADGLAQPFALVICTGHGPIAIAPAQDNAPAHKSKPDAPCAFAGHGAGAAPPSEIALATAERASYRQAASPISPDLAPGRGLAAPPPPSQGPPRLP